MTLDGTTACATCKAAVTVHFECHMTWNRARGKNTEEQKHELGLDEGEEELWPVHHPCHIKLRTEGFNISTATWIKLFGPGLVPVRVSISFYLIESLLQVGRVFSVSQLHFRLSQASSSAMRNTHDADAS